MNPRSFRIVSILQEFLYYAEAVLIPINKIRPKESNHSFGVNAHSKFVCHHPYSAIKALLPFIAYLHSQNP